MGPWALIFRGFGAQLRKRKYRNGAKHSPPSLGSEVAQRAKNESFEIKRANSISFFLINHKVLALSPGFFPISRMKKCCSEMVSNIEMTNEMRGSKFNFQFL